MISKETVLQQMSYNLDSIDIEGVGNKIPGKVRDSYVVGDKRLLVTSDRLSAFDVILSTIPFKGQVLNDMAAYWFDRTAHIIENHIISRPHPNVFLAREAEILPIEVIVRGYLTGSAWRDYHGGKDVSGIKLPEGLRKSEKFAEPLLTPSTKAAHGEHDEPISSEEIVKQGIVSAPLWEEVSQKALELFEFGSKVAAEQGLILVDTKYEFGLLDDGNGGKKLILADEVHTSDSSRYWIKDKYAEAYETGEEPPKLDKEFVRAWLIEQGYLGEGTPPSFEDDFRAEVALKYIEAFETITGQTFEAKPKNIKDDVQAAISGLKLG